MSLHDQHAALLEKANPDTIEITHLVIGPGVDK